DQQQYSQAQTAFQNAIDLDYRYPEAHYNLGVTFLRQNSPETAIIAFKRATELQPMFGHAYYAMGLALADLQRYEEAESSLQTAANIYISEGNAQWASNAQVHITQIQNLKMAQPE
ncbi:MAG: tetratricopeptide repeat protein, partial [Phormidesmis sp.]